jgi:hypothetical protein
MTLSTVGIPNAIRTLAGFWFFSVDVVVSFFDYVDGFRSYIC